MFTLRIVRHDRNDQVLAECQGEAVPARGEVLRLDTVDDKAEKIRPSTLWRVVTVTFHIPSLSSTPPADGSPLAVRMVEVSVLPDVSLVPELAHTAEAILSESRM